MALQNWTSGKAYPYVLVNASLSDISAFLLGEDIFNRFRCELDFKIGERLFTNEGASVTRIGVMEYKLQGYSQDVSYIGSEELPEDLVIAIEDLVDLDLCNSWQIIKD